LALLPVIEPGNGSHRRKNKAMNRTLLLICTALAASACERSSERAAMERSSERSSEQSPADRTSIPPPAPPGGTGESKPAGTSLGNQPGAGSAQQRVPVSGSDEHAANDTGKNERDRSGATATSGDQSESEADLRITQKIRQAVVDDSELSATAKNVKIVTKEGVVTLRGPVKSSQEKSQIASVAQRVDGVKRIDNQLEIASK
jgi:hypothetical protein